MVKLLCTDVLSKVPKPLEARQDYEKLERIIYRMAGYVVVILLDINRPYNIYS